MVQHLIIAHHPPIFRPLKNIYTDTPQGSMIEKCIKNDISVYAAHTNLDVAPGGVNDMLANIYSAFKKRKLLNQRILNHFINLQSFARFPMPKKFVMHLRKLVRGQLVIMQDVVSLHRDRRLRLYEGANPYIGKIGEQEEC